MGTLIRTKHYIAILLACFIQIIAYTLCYAQNPENFNLKQLGVNEGISHSDVTSIIQDNSGYLWLGTNNGLNKYDGNRIKIFKSNPSDKSGLPESKITKLFKDSRGLIWIGMQSAGLCVYNTETEQFNQVSLLPGVNNNGKPTRVSEIREDHTGAVWVAVRNMGLFRVTVNKAGKVTHIQNKQLSVQPNNHIPDVFCFTIISATKLLLGTDSGLYLYNYVTDEITRLNYTGNEKTILALCQDKQKNILIGRDDGLFIIHTNTIALPNAQVLPVKINTPLSNIRVVFLDKSNNLWLGTFGYGTYRIAYSAPYNNNDVLKAVAITKENSKDDFIGGIERINCFFEDKYGLIWIGTSAGGAGYFNTRQKNIGLISNLNYRNALPDNYITAVYSQGGEIWIGTHKGLSIHNTAGKFETYLKDKFITDIYRDNAGIYWVSTKTDGLKKIVRNNNNLQITDVDAQYHLGGKLNSNELICVTEDQWDRLWVATVYNGIYILSADRRTITMFTQQSAGPHLSSNKVNNLYRDPVKPWMWVSTKDGLNRVEFKQGHISKVKAYVYKADSNSISANYVWPVIRGNDSTIWAGTLGGGLNKITFSNKKEKITHYTIANGLYDNDIEAIEIDNKGKLWLAGYGLTKFNPQKGVEVFFDHNDGMQSNAFKIGASFKDATGKLYFGGINGLNYFYPDSIGGNQPAPDILLTGIRIFNKPVAIGQPVSGQVILKKALNFTSKVVLTASQNDFTIEFAGLQFSGSSKMKYYYTLKHYSPDWTETDVSSASFSNLEAGKYTFMIYASNNGVNSVVKTIDLEILPPWYLTWWAFTIYVIITAGAFYTYRNIITKENMLKSELLIAEKEKSLNMAKLDFFTNISHELRTPLSLIYGPVTELLQKQTGDSSRDKLWLIYRNTKRLMTLANQLLDFRKMESDKLQLKTAEGDIVKFIREIWLIFKDKARASNISYHISTEQEKIRLFFDHEKMELVFSNLLSNAFKYTREGATININIYIKGDAGQDAVYERIDGKEVLTLNYIEIVIEDNGVGIPQPEAEKIFDTYYQVSNSTSLKSTGTGLGLSIAKGIIDMHKGFIRVESRLGQGSRFITGLPFGKSHLHRDSIIEDYKGPDNLSNYEDEQGLLPAIDTTEEIASVNGITANAIEVFTVDADIENNSEEKNGSVTEWNMLIVEDNEELLNYLKTNFSKKFKVITARNGKEGFEKAKSMLPDIVISDVMMPEMDGLEMCKKIKADPEVNFIPVILLTARTASVYEIEGIETGADDYITKPFNIRLLNAKVNNFLHARLQLKEYYRKLISLDATKPDINSADELFINKMIQIVEANLTNKNFGVVALSQELAMSKSSVFKRVKDITGGNLVDFIRGVRMRRAAALLLTETLNVNEVALVVGISDLKYFREQFKKYFGSTPSEYVKITHITREHAPHQA